jgi:hypothetical protein
LFVAYGLSTRACLNIGGVERDSTLTVAQVEAEAQAWRAALATLAPDRSVQGRRVRDEVAGALVAVVAVVEGLRPDGGG